MKDGDFWTTVTDNYAPVEAAPRLASLKLALVFAAVAAISALVLTPILAVDAPYRLARSPGDYDPIVTGSVSSSGPMKFYTIRKSILQPRPDSVCIIHINGQKLGEC